MVTTTANTTNDSTTSTNTDAAIDESDKVENTELKENGNRPITISASIESDSPSSYQLGRKSSVSIGMGSWDSSSKSNSVDSFTSHDVLLK